MLTGCNVKSWAHTTETPLQHIHIHSRLIDRVVVLRLTPKAKIHHFGEAAPSQSLGLVWKKLNPTQQKHEFTNQKKCKATQKTKARFSRLFATSGLEMMCIYSQWKRKQKQLSAAQGNFAHIHSRLKLQ